MSETLRLGLQQGLVREMTVCPELLRMLQPHLHAAFFGNPSLGWAYSQLVAFYHQHKALPDLELMLQLTSGLDAGTARLHQDEVRAIYAIVPAAQAQQGFLRDWAVRFAKKKLMVAAIQQATAQLQAGDDEGAIATHTEAAREMHAVTHVTPDRTFLTEDLDAWLQERAERQRRPPPFIPTGLPRLDLAMGGGLEKGRLGLVLGETKAGKSTVMRNFARTACDAGYTVLYLVYEGTRDEVDAAFHTLWGEHPRRLRAGDAVLPKLAETLRRRYAEVPGSLIIRSFTQIEQGAFSQTVDGIHDEVALLTEMGRRPDLIMVDYGDLLRSSRPAGSMYEDQVAVHNDLKLLANKHFAVWSGTQARRQESRATHHHTLGKDDVAHCIDKARVCDVMVSINVTDEEREAGQGRLHIAIQRSGESGKTWPLRMQMDRGLITEMEDPDAWVHADAPAVRSRPRPAAAGQGRCY